MASVDSLLGMVVTSAADELHLGTDASPRILKKGAPMRLSIPPTDGDTLRHLLGELLTPEREGELAQGRAVALAYRGGGDDFAVSMKRGPGGRLEVAFKRGAAQRAAGAGAGAPALSSAPSPSASSPPFAAPPPSASSSSASSPSAPFAASPPSARFAAPSSSAPSSSAPSSSAPSSSAPSSSAPFAASPSSSPSAPFGAPPDAGPQPSAPSAAPASFAPFAAPRPAVAAVPDAALVDLLQQAVARQASDVHLFTGEVPSLRVDGRLLAVAGWPPADPSVLLGGVLDEAARALLAAGHAVDRSFELDGIGRFRAHVYLASGRLAAALRVLPRLAPRLANLRFPVPVDALVEAPHGLVLVCGPTGSGKSATLAALAGEALRRRHGLLISLEDPIEYALSPEHGLVRQRHVGVDVRDFPSGLKDALREDPDILLIGEMRDPESISLALTAAETGHLVLASLHSRSAASSIERIVDAYPAERQGQIRLQLADSLRAILAQRLLPRARGGGRIPACEILRGTTGIASLIREGKTAQLPNAIQSGRKEGMLLLERCLADLVRAGEIDRKDALAVANDPVSLAAYIQG